MKPDGLAEGVRTYADRAGQREEIRAALESVPPGWHIAFDLIEGSVRVVNPLTGEWRP